MSGSPAGYSGTPLVRKLGIKPASRLGLIGAPDGFAVTLGELPVDVSVRRRIRGPLDVIVAFFVRRAELERRLPALAAALDPTGGLWIAWPKPPGPAVVTVPRLTSARAPPSPASPRSAPRSRSHGRRSSRAG